MACPASLGELCSPHQRRKTVASSLQRQLPREGRIALCFVIIAQEIISFVLLYLSLFTKTSFSLSFIE